MRPYRPIEIYKEAEKVAEVSSFIPNEDMIIRFIGIGASMWLMY